MPAAIADHQDTAGLQIPRHSDTAASGASAATFTLVNGSSSGVNDAAWPVSPGDRERMEVGSPLTSGRTCANLFCIVGGAEEAARGAELRQRWS
jgi:hypothetical protein